MSYDTIVQPFSQCRLFSPVGGNVTNVDFFLPGGGNIAATSTGFGAVFSDVDQPDGSGPSSSQVRITSGDALPSLDDEPNRDVVMMDDFIYGEPRIGSEATAFATGSTRPT